MVIENKKNKTFSAQERQENASPQKKEGVALHGKNG